MELASTTRAGPRTVASARSPGRFARISAGFGREELAVAVLAALPSLVWAVWGADYLTDDFEVAYRLRPGHLVEGMVDLSFHQPGRILTGPYYALIYRGIGDVPVAQAFVLGALNSVMAVSVLKAARVALRPRTAFFAALCVAAMPHRGSTRLWFVLGPNVLAVSVVAVGIVILARRGECTTKSLLVPGLVFGLAILLYEATIGLVAAALAIWILIDAKRRVVPGLAAIGVVGLAALTSVALSSKSGSAELFDPSALETIVPGLLAGGVWGAGAMAWIGALVLTATLAVTAVRSLASHLPGFAHLRSEFDREVRIAATLAAIGLLPFVVLGLSFATRGIFDRNNLVPSIGICLLLGALLSAIVGGSKRYGTAIAVVVLIWFSFLNLQDVDDYRDAARRGDELVAAVLRDVDPHAAGTVIVGPAIDEGRGVEQFVYHGDLRGALVLRHGERWDQVFGLGSPSSCSDRAAEADASLSFYDHEANRLSSRPPRWCEAERR